MIRIYIIGLFCLCFMVLSGAMPSQVIAQAEGYKLVISEVMWMGSDISTADEWLEFVNVSSGSINISGWKVDYLKSDEEAVMFEFPQGTLIEAGQYFVVSNYDQENSRLAIEPDLVDSSISLPNSKLHLWLKDSDGNIMDEVDDGSGAPFAGENPSPSAGAKASMERIDIMSSGSDKSNWMSAETSLGFDEGVEIYGSPGRGDYQIDQEGTEGGEGGEGEEGEEGGEGEEGEEGGEGSGSVVIPKVLISEVFPNPKGKDDNEWIEIINYENYSVDVSGWKIKRGNEEYVFEEYVIRPDGIFVLGKSETDLSLKNSGDTIELLSGSLLIDSFYYPKMEEGISYGRRGDDRESFATYCVPTKGEQNRVKKQYPRIIVQSGKKRDEDKVTINFDLSVDHGSLEGAFCTWDFDDGEQSFKCNPPSHTWNEVGVYAVTLGFQSACGGYEEATEYVEVLETPRESKEGKEGKEGGEGGEGWESSEGGESQEGQPPPAQVYLPADDNCIPTISSGVTIIEVFPSPNAGDEEWIKFKNNLDHEFNLCGWIIDDVRDGGSKSWTIPEEYQILPQGELVLKQSETHISLNNSGDEVWLISPDESIEISVEYPKVKKGDSYLFVLDKGNPTQPIIAQGYIPAVVELTSSPGGHEEIFAMDKEVNGLGGVAPVAVRNSVPLRQKYKNILPASAVSPESEIGSGQNLSGVFLDMKMWEPSDEDQQIDIEENGIGKEIALIIGGIFSTIGVFVLKVFRG